MEISPKKQFSLIMGAMLALFSFNVTFFIHYWGFNEERNFLIDNNRPQQNFIDIESPEMVFGLPVRLKIPKINVNAGFVYVALTSDGAMDVPKGPDEVAWFNLSRRPGESGSAVVSGHYGWKDGIPAVFDDLNKLEKGDIIIVEDERGMNIPFVVREYRVYDWDANAPDVFASNDGRAHLNLITCGGVWDKTNKNYSKRLVVFADKVDSVGSL